MKRASAAYSIRSTYRGGDSLAANLSPSGLFFHLTNTQENQTRVKLAISGGLLILIFVIC